MYDAESWKYSWFNKPRISFEIANLNVRDSIFENIQKNGIKCSKSSRKTRNLHRIDITGDKQVILFEELYPLRAGKSQL